MNAEPKPYLAGERSSGEGKPVSNRILLALPDAEFHAIRPFLSYVPLSPHMSLHNPGERIEFAYLPNNGLVSLVVAMKEGKTVEVGVVGNEGIIGTPALLGLDSSLLRAVVQIPGGGFRIPVETLRGLRSSTRQFHYLASRHAVIQGMQAAQSAACNRLHGIEQRLARWLLIMQDRTDDEILRITHDFLATMLGTDRPSVSLAAGLLQRKETIQYTRGAVRILNRKKLEESACECYRIIQQFNGPLGLPNGDRNDGR
ncbi:MAG: Crp/Fnr family transcriptional regulator [Acidobacteria bacterium]|nr:Crp/Fnr family transcriptional regulator [Acidobacteriota bacterium]